MKKILLVMLILLVNMDALANDELSEIKASLRKEEQEGKEEGLSSNTVLYAKISKYLVANKDTSPKDFKKMKVLEKISMMVHKNLVTKYPGVLADNSERKINNTADREMYKITLDINKKNALRGHLFCTGDEAAALESAKRSGLLRGKLRTLPALGDEQIKVYEQMLTNCKYDDDAIWSVLVAYRSNNHREQYNKLMLRIIKEDQADYDYSGSSLDEIDGTFKTEFRLFLTNMNPLKKDVILSKEQVQLVAEAALTKYQEVFSLQGVRSEEEAFYIVQPIVVLSGWLGSYQQEDLRKRVANAFLTSDLAKRTLKVYSQNMKGFKETSDFVDRMSVH